MHGFVLKGNYRTIITDFRNGKFKTNLTIIMYLTPLVRAIMGGMFKKNLKQPY